MSRAVFAAASFLDAASPSVVRDAHIAVALSVVVDASSLVDAST